MDFLKSAVASAISKEPSFPYKFVDKLTLDQSIWTLHNGTRREDGSDCSILAFDIIADRSRLPLARNAVRKLRTLRHPGIIKVLETVESETHIYVATERITPLAWSVRRKSLSIETLKWGLFTIANTLSFINDEAVSVHGSVRLSSIYISQRGEWRLGGLEVLSSMKDDDAVIFRYANSIPKFDHYVPPETTKSGWETIKRHLPFAVDSFGFGILIFEVFNGTFISIDQIGQAKNVPPNMLQSYKRLMNANPKSRLSITHFRDQGRRSGGFFQTPLIQLSEGIDSLGLKSESEREELLRPVCLITEINKISEDFPEEFFSRKVLPELLKSVEFGGGGPKVFVSVIKIANKISDEEWDAKITPVVVRLFSNPDRAIRVSLLDNLPDMIEHLSQKTVNDKIFPQMVTGFTDVAPLVREQTVKAILTIIPKLSERTSNGELLKYLAKTANDEQPGIRTNTTICLGKIARNLGVNTRQKVLVAAFARSLKDPFVHARNAALLALATTSDLFNEEDCANKILPALCVSLIDKEKLIRDQANKCFDVYLQRIRKYGNLLPETVLPMSNTISTNGAVPRIGTMQNDSAGWAGWAISSFTNKLGSASGEMQSNTAQSHFRSNDRLSSVAPTVENTRVPLLTSPPSNLHNQASSSTSTPARGLTPTKHALADLVADGEEIDEAWGDMVEDDFFDAPSGLRSEKAPPTSFDDCGEPDFEGWLKAQAQAKPKAPLPKGLKKSQVPTVHRTTTTGSMGSGAGPKKLASTPSKSRVTPVRIVSATLQDTDEDWGDAWE